MKNFFLKSIFSLFAAAWMSITLAAAENTQNPPASDINALKIRAKQEWQNRKYPQARKGRRTCREDFPSGMRRGRQRCICRSPARAD